MELPEIGDPGNYKVTVSFTINGQEKSDVVTYD